MYVSTYGMIQGKEGRSANRFTFSRLDINYATVYILDMGGGGSLE